MLICKICGKEYKNMIGLGAHIRVHNITAKEYYDMYNKKYPNEGICKYCGNPTNFLNGTLGYSEHCSIKCSTNSEIVREKYKNTCLERYGEESFLLNKNIRKRIIETNLKKYGSKSPVSSKEVRQKIKNTLFSNYGVEYPIQSEEIKEKMKGTNLKKFGVENVSQCKKIKEKIYFQTRKSFFTKLLNSDRLKDLVTPNFTLDDYSNVKDAYEWTCNKCGHIFISNLDNGSIPRCLNCFPLLARNKSHYESEISDFLKENNISTIIQNDRSIISPLELDIYLPDHNLAIEFNGLFWHSELNGKDKNYHLNKSLQCYEKNITLLHIFEDEWIFKQEIVKSIILNKLGKTPNRILARKCQIKELSFDKAFKFLDENHLQGFINSKYHFGLLYNNSIVSILSIGKPRFNKNYQWEVLRFCNRSYHSVIGAFSKLLSYFCSSHQGSIITYSDIRLGLDSFYKKVGFQFINRSEPNYYYIKEGCNRESRLKYQKHLLKDKLKIFDPILTEWQNMQLNNYDRIWDCGNLVYVID